MADVTMEDLFVAIKDLSVDIKEIKEAVGNLETEMQEMKTELKYDIRKLGIKYKTLTQDVMDVRTDMAMLQKEVY